MPYFPVCVMAKEGFMKGKLAQSTFATAYSPWTVGYMAGRFSLYPDLSVEENLTFFASVFGTTIEREFAQIKPIYAQLEPFKDRRAAAHGICDAFPESSVARKRAGAAQDRTILWNQTASGAE